MKKAESDPKVKKTLLRNYEQKIRAERKGVHDLNPGSSKLLCGVPLKCQDHNLNEPTICSSEVLSNYVTNIRKSVPTTLAPEDLNIDKAQVSAKITKKLNFHFNDRIYKNLIELNADISSQSKQDKKNIKNKVLIKKDLEPNIEDFCEEEKDADICPNIPILKRHITLVKGEEDGRLHRLVASFELL